MILRQILMNVKSRLFIYLADLRKYDYAFSEDVTLPSGGKAVSEDELGDVLSNSQLIRQIMEEAGRRITDIVPVRIIDYRLRQTQSRHK